MFQNFNFQLFDLFEQKLGMGEDLLLGHLLSKAGTVKYIPTLLFLHNDQRCSTYTADHYSFGRRTLYSRLFLSIEYARLNNENYSKARAIFYYFAFMRISGLILNILIKRNQETKKLLNGFIEGLKLSISFKYAKDNQCEKMWMNELKMNNF